MRENKAITLIALVVTIIVLLILASVSLNLVLGEHGIITMAKTAKENMELAQVEEQTALNSLYEQLYGNSIGGSGNSVDTQGGGTETPDLPVQSYQKVEDAKNMEDGYFKEETTLEDSDGNHVVIPAGFKIAEDSGKNVTEGIVIEDNDIQIDGNGQQRGNQYVWIPVSNIDGSDSNPIKKSDGTEVVITLGRYEFADGTKSYTGNNSEDLGQLKKGTEILRQKAKDYATPISIESSYQELATYREGVKDESTGLNRSAKDLAGFVTSVEKNGGYYIARFEASYGIDEKPNFKVSINENNLTWTQNKTEGCLWNVISQIDAAEACENLYATMKSDLVNSYAWDTALVYIQMFSENSDDYSRQIGGLINNKLVNTGKNHDEVCKINDMASNTLEWTTEYSPHINSNYNTPMPCVYRGGYFYSNYDFTSYRSSSGASSGYNYYCSFRCILYLDESES